MGPTLPSRGPRRAAAATLLLALALRAGGLSAGPLEVGQAALEARRYAEAADAFSRAWAGAPEAARRAPALGLASAVTLGRLTDRLGAADEALSDVVARDLADVGARVALGELRLLTAQGQADPTERERTRARAGAQFEQALLARPGDVPAALGLARCWQARGRLDRALAALEPLLAGEPEPRVLVAKARLLYEQGHADNEANPGSLPAREQVRQARGILKAATTADPASFDAWLTLGLCAQQLADSAAAGEAYAKAMALDAESPAPLEALGTLLADDPAALLARLEKLAAEIPGQVAVHLALGRAHVEAQRWEAAAKELSQFLERSTVPDQRARAYTPLGQALTGLGREAEAVRAFEQALDADPRDLFAADGLDQRLQRTYVDTAQTDLRAAERCAEDYERLVKRTRENLFVLNNVAYLLREAYVKHQADGTWLTILKSATHFYVEAAKIVADKPPDVLARAPWGDRYAWAEVTNDAGHMFHAFAPTQDLAKAETLFLRALVLSENGCYDAWINLNALYEAEHDYRKAYELAGRVAEHLRQEDGAPHAEGRAAALALRQRLVNEGKVKERKGK